MINKTIWFLIIFFIPVLGEPTITFFIRPYPEIKTNPDAVNNKLQIPGYLGYKMLKKEIPFYNKGIPCLYAGTIAFSDNQGMVRFTRSSKKTDFNFVVSEDIKPVFLVPWVIDHWLSDETKSAWYSVTGFTDQPTKATLWNVEKSPEQKIIPNYAIIIFAPHKKIYVPEGVSMADFGQQIVLPPVYSKIKNYSPENTVKIMSIKQFFAPVKKIFDKTNSLIEQINS